MVAAIIRRPAKQIRSRSTLYHSSGPELRFCPLLPDNSTSYCQARKTRYYSESGQPDRCADRPDTHEFIPTHALSSFLPPVSLSTFRAAEFLGSDYVFCSYSIKPPRFTDSQILGHFFRTEYLPVRVGARKPEAKCGTEYLEVRRCCGNKYI